VVKRQEDLDSILNWTISSYMSSHRPTLHVNTDILELTVIFQNQEQPVSIHRERTGSDLYEWARNTFQRDHLLLLFRGLSLKADATFIEAGVYTGDRIHA